MADDAARAVGAFLGRCVVRVLEASRAHTAGEVLAATPAEEVRLRAAYAGVILSDATRTAAALRRGKDRERVKDEAIAKAIRLLGGGPLAAEALPSGTPDGRGSGRFPNIPGFANLGNRYPPHPQPRPPGALRLSFKPTEPPEPA